MGHVDIAADQGPSMDEVGRLASSNDEAIGAWDGVLFERFLRFRHIVTDGLGAHGEAALAAHPPAVGDRALDIGCGFGDTTQRLSELVGPEGSAVGIDAAPSFIELAREESSAANVEFAVGDVQVADLGGPFDYAFSRMGTMFFANPVAAMRNVRSALAPGGRLCMVVWRRKLDNGWLHGPEVAVKAIVTPDEASDEPTCGPGPFSMSNADTTSEILITAGFEDVELRRCDLPIMVGADIDEALEMVMALGPAGEALRLAGDDAERLRPRVESALRDVLAPLKTEQGVSGSASTWIVSASAPA